MSTATKLPPSVAERLADINKYVECGREGPRNVSAAGSGGTFDSIGLENYWDIDKFNKNFSLKIRYCTESSIQFEMIGIDTAFANAFRRLLLSDVPTMAIETCHMFQNTGVIQDEVLVHRIALIPFKLDPANFKYRTENEPLSDANSMKFQLKIKADARTNIAAGKNYLPVYSKDLKWIPLSKSQEEKYKNHPPKPVSDNILITKLAHNQEIEVDLYLEKGIGKTHAKWMPVAPVWYRLMPSIDFPKGDLIGEEAEELKAICPKQVFDIEDNKVVVKDNEACTTCRACLDRFDDRVRIRKRKDHFIFTIESTGALPAKDLFLLSIKALEEKLVKLKQTMTRFLPSTANNVEAI